MLKSFLGHDRKLIKQIIGRITHGVLFKPQVIRNLPVIDNTQPDYEWWDKFRHGLQKGYEIAGSQAQSLIEVLSAYAVGRGVVGQLAPVTDKRMPKKVDYTNAQLHKLSLAYQSDLSKVFEETLALGDQYIIVNPDGSLTFPSSDTIYPEFEDDNNPFLVTGYTYYIRNITGLEITEKYTKEKRTRIVKKNGEVIFSKTFPNQANVLPVVAFHHNRGRNELFGRPVYYSLLKIFADLDDLTIRSLSGAKISANPMPVFEGMSDIDETIEANTTLDDQRYTNIEGEEQTRRILDWEEISALFIGEGGRFNFASPPQGFSEDVTRIIELTYRYIQNKMHLPDFTLPGEPNMSDKEAQAAMPPFVRYVIRLREEFAQKPEDPGISSSSTYGLQYLLHVWLKTTAVFDSKIFVGPTVVKWNDLTQDVEELQFEKVKWAHSRALLTNVEALRLLDLIDDPTLEVELAQAELEAKQLLEPDQFDDFGGGNLTADKTPDERKEGGADAPRMPATAGGGRTQ